MDNLEIGRRIESRRKELGLTLDDIASTIGVARSTIQRYERGKIDKLKLPVLEAISRVLHVNAGWLLGVEPLTFDPDEDEKKQLPESEELSQAQKDLIALVSSLPEETCQAVLLLLRQQFPPDAPDDG